MFQPGQVVAIGASGGKDSTVLAYMLKHLNEKYSYGLKLVLLSIDEGITGCFLYCFTTRCISYKCKINLTSYCDYGYLAIYMHFFLSTQVIVMTVWNLLKGTKKNTTSLLRFYRTKIFMGGLWMTLLNK